MRTEQGFRSLEGPMTQGCEMMHMIRQGLVRGCRREMWLGAVHPSDLRAESCRSL